MAEKDDKYFIKFRLISESWRPQIIITSIFMYSIEL